MRGWSTGSELCPDTLASLTTSGPAYTLPIEASVLAQVKFLELLLQAGRVQSVGDGVDEVDAPAQDMRKVKSAERIIYTTGKSWWIRKGGTFRGNEEQMHEHCALLVGSGVFKGNAYSYGDEYIGRCAIKKAPPSSLMWWKDVAINHRMMHMLDDLSTPGAAP